MRTHLLYFSLISLLSLPSAAYVTGRDNWAGSKAAGCGSAFTSVADDPTAVYWNPAGLAQQERIQLSLFDYAYKDLNNAFAGLAVPTGKHGAFGAGAARNSRFGELIRSATVQTDTENILSFSYAMRFNPRFTGGITANSVQRERLGSSGSGMSADFGLIFKPMRNMAAAFSAKNILETGIRYGGYDYDIPWRCRLGLSYYAQIWREKLGIENYLPIKKIKSTSLSAENVMLSIDFEANEFSDTVSVYRCIEIWMHDLLVFRLGAGRETFREGNIFNSFFRINEPVVGLGVKLEDVSIDFSYSRTDEPVSLTASLRFGGKVAGLDYSRWEIEKRALESREAGETCYREGKLAQALAEWEKALVWDPGDKALQEKMKQAEAELEVAANRKIVENYINRAYMSYEEGRLLEALDNWQRILEIEPANTRAREYADKITAKLTEADRKKFTDDRLLQQKEKIAGSMKNADLFFEKGKYQAALEEWRRVLRVNPAHAEALENVKKAEMKLAAAAAAAAAKPAPTARTAPVDTRLVSQQYYKAADLYLEGSYRQAERTLAGILELDPANENAAALLEKVRSVMETLSK